MLRILNEENSELKNRVFPIPDGVKKHLRKIADNYKGDKTVDGYKRLNNLLENDVLSYREMKRIKNFFDSYKGVTESVPFILNGGEPMRDWVNNTLNRARKVVDDFKKAKKDAGIDNAYIKPHEKNRQTKTTKPTQTKFNTTNRNMINNNTLKYESKKRTLIITERQEKVLKEAMDDVFSFEKLSSISSYNARFQYCTKHLGKHIGKGSSRATFQLDDEKVLKLAWNEKGVAQNNEEWNTYDGGVLPEVFDRDVNGLWLVSEFVLPARAKDFRHCFGLSFQEFCAFLCSCAKYRFNWKFWLHLPEEEWIDLLENNDDLREFDDFIGNRGTSVVGDMLRMVNYGLAKRNGQASIVLLDSGLSEDVWKKYYAQR